MYFCRIIEKNTVMRIRHCLFIFLLSLAVLPLGAQTPTTQGTDFWLSFMRNGYRTGASEKLTLIASAKEHCTVTVTNPSTSFQTSFEVSDNSVNTLVISDSDGYNDQQGGSAYKGLRVTATDTISLYIANEAENSYDAANVLPVAALGNHYMIQSNKSEGEQSNHYRENRAAFLVVATQDDTEVRITPKIQTWDGHAAGQTYTVALDAGQCYHVLNLNAGASTNSEGDFTGTIVESDSDKPIAVFNGNCITSVPGGLTYGYDHVFEQAMPTDFWGNRFVVTSIKQNYQGMSADLVKVTALNDNTTVTRDGSPLAQLNSGESTTFNLDLNTNPCSFLESDNPVAVFVYNHSHGSGYTTNYGDPSMVWISPVEQTVFEVTFSTFQAAHVTNHFVNVVCYTDHVQDLTLDGNNISESFETVIAAPEFSYARVAVQQGAHTLRCPGGFVAYVYGYGDVEGYAYTVGSSAKILTKQLYVNGILSSELPGDFGVCQNDDVTFHVATNYDIHHVDWNFGDNVTGTGEEITHAYANAGNFAVSSIIYRTIDNIVQPFDTLSVTVPVNPNKEHDDDVVYTCEDTYLFNGHYYDVPGDYDVTMETQTGCDSIVHIHLQKEAPTIYNMEPITTCASSVTIDGTSYDVPGEYNLPYQTTSGCDSIVHVTLLSGDQNILYLPPVTVCEQYDWFGEIVVSEGLNHLEHTVPNASPEGCDSLYIQDVTIGYPPMNSDTTISSCDSMFYWGYWLNATMDVSHTFFTPEGCDYDSILHFILLPSGNTFDTIIECDSYSWFNGTSVVPLTESNDYEGVFIGENGCESHLYLNLTIKHTPPFNEIKGLSYVPVATNYWPGEYYYFLDDSTGMAPGSVLWELSDNENGEWDFRPHGASCAIVAYTMGTKVLHVSANDNGLCEKEAEKIINCTGYAVDETELNRLKVYPNPAQEELIVEGEQLTGIVIYNLLGQKLKEVKTAQSPVQKVDVSDLPQALYLVNVSTLMGNKTQLILVTR